MVYNPERKMPVGSKPSTGKIESSESYCDLLISLPATVYWLALVKDPALSGLWNHIFDKQAEISASAILGLEGDSEEQCFIRLFIFSQKMFKGFSFQISDFPVQPTKSLTAKKITTGTI